MLPSLIIFFYVSTLVNIIAVIVVVINVTITVLRSLIIVLKSRNYNFFFHFTVFTKKIINKYHISCTNLGILCHSIAYLIGRQWGATTLPDQCTIPMNIKLFYTFHGWHVRHGARMYMDVSGCIIWIRLFLLRHCNTFFHGSRHRIVNIKYVVIEVYWKPIRLDRSWNGLGHLSYNNTWSTTSNKKIQDVPFTLLNESSKMYNWIKHIIVFPRNQSIVWVNLYRKKNQNTYYLTLRENSSKLPFLNTSVTFCHFLIFGFTF